MAEGDDAWWAAAIFIGAPNAVRNLRVTARPQGGLTWGFDAPQGGGPITRYEYRSQFANGNFGGAWISTGTGRVIALTGLDPVTSYKVQVRAVGVGGTGPIEEDTDSTGAVTPRKPTGFTVAPAGQAFRLRATVDNGGAAITKWQRRGASTSGGIATAAWTDIPSSAANTVNWLSGNFGYSTQRFFQVRAFNNQGTGASSDIEDATTGTAPLAAPGPPRNLDAAVTLTSIVWTWDAPNTGGAVASYEYRTSTSGTFSGSWTSNGTSRTVTLSSLGNGVTRHIQVRSVNATDNSAAVTDSATTAEDTTAPSFVSANVNAAGTLLTIVFDEDLAGAAPALSAFNIQRVPLVGATQRKSGNTISIANDEVRIVFTIPILGGDTVTVAYTRPTQNPLQDAAGNETASFLAQSVTNNVSLAVPGPVRNLAESRVTRTSITWEWDAPNTGGVATGYEARIAAGSAAFSGAWTDLDTDTTAVATGLTAGSTHRIQVRARNPSGPAIAADYRTDSATATADTMTTDEDTIWTLASSLPGAPAGGTSTEAHTPNGWRRTEPNPTVSNNVYRATRTRTYTNGVFTSATAWGSVTKVADATGTGTTTNTDHIYTRGTTAPDAPAGGTATVEHTPAGWTRSEPAPTATMNVYRAERTRTYSNGVFQSATAWGSVTKVADAVPPTRTTDTDHIYTRAATAPAAPAGGTDTLAHTPTGWQRGEPSPTATQNVYRASRTRIYLDGVFSNATAWGSVTKVADAQPVETEDTDTIWRLSATEPTAPAGGTDSGAHTPTGWTRTEPSPTATLGVYRARRSRTFLNGVFQSATAWGDVTLVSAPTSTEPLKPTSFTITVSLNRVRFRASVDNGGSTITKWQFRAATTEAGIASATWTDFGTSASSTLDESGTQAYSRQVYYQVRAVNMIGNGAASDIVSATTGAQPTVIIATATGAGTWTVPSGVTAIMVELVGAGGGGSSDSGSCGGGGGGTTFGTLVAGGGGGGTTGGDGGGAGLGRHPRDQPLGRPGQGGVGGGGAGGTWGVNELGGYGGSGGAGVATFKGADGTGAGGGGGSPASLPGGNGGPDGGGGGGSFVETPGLGQGGKVDISGRNASGFGGGGGGGDTAAGGDGGPGSGSLGTRTGGEGGLSGADGVEGLDDYGAGGFGRFNGGSASGAGGGGGGYTVDEAYTVTPGARISYFVGGGGQGEQAMADRRVQGITFPVTRVPYNAGDGDNGVIRITYSA